MLIDPIIQASHSLRNLPEDIFSDQGALFTSRVWTAFFQSPTAIPNACIRKLRFLRMYCHQNQTNWREYLVWAEYAQNFLHKPSTGLTPFQCILGFQPPLLPWTGEPTELSCTRTPVFQMSRASTPISGGLGQC